MGIILEEVIPLGRSKKEYVEMFLLTEEILKGKILDCGSGPSSFNAEMMNKGSRVISIDPNI